MKIEFESSKDADTKDAQVQTTIVPRIRSHGRQRKKAI